jgi:hypothetical protein
VGQVAAKRGVPVDEVTPEGLMRIEEDVLYLFVP